MSLYAMCLYALALAITLTVEAAIALLWRRLMARPIPKHDLLLAVAAVNLISHPQAWMTFAAFPDAFWLIECIVVIGEAMGLMVLIKLPKNDAIGMSLIGNSATVALCLMGLVG